MFTFAGIFSFPQVDLSHSYCADVRFPLKVFLWYSWGIVLHLVSVLCMSVGIARHVTRLTQRIVKTALMRIIWQRSWPSVSFCWRTSECNKLTAVGGANIRELLWAWPRYFLSVKQHTNKKARNWKKMFNWQFQENIVYPDREDMSTLRKAWGQKQEANWSHIYVPSFSGCRKWIESGPRLIRLQLKETFWHM